MKRDLAKKLIERYFYLITEGCGNSECVNDYCASSKRCTTVVSANDAAAIAIQLFRLDARLCDQHPMKVARTTNNSSVSGNTLYEATTSLACSSNTQESQRLSHDASVQTNSCTVFQVNPVHTTDLSRSLSDTQISLTRTSSQTDINAIPCMVVNNTPYQEEEISAGIPQGTPIYSLNSAPYQQEVISDGSPPVTSIGSLSNTPYEQEEISNDYSHVISIDSFNNTSFQEEEIVEDYPQTTSVDSSEAPILDSTINEDEIKKNKMEEINPTGYKNGDNIVDILNVGSLSIPDCIMNELRDMNMCLGYMDNMTMTNPLEHVACYETGIKYLSEANVNDLVNLGPNQFKNNSQLLCALYQVFSSPEALGNSFIRTQECKEDIIELVNDVKTVFPSTKEKLREMEVEKEIAEDCMDEGIVDELNCVADELNCVADELNCVADDKNCDADNTNCGADITNCDADNTSCDANNTNCDVDNTKYEAENTYCETDQMDCESDGEKCKLDGELSERQLDVAGLARAYKQMSSADDEGNYKDVLCIAIGSLCAKITVELHFFKSKSFPISDKYLEEVLHSLKIVYEMPWLDDLVFVERVVPRLVAATCVLPVTEQAKLAKFWCEMSSENTLCRILHCLQEAITFQLISTEYDSTFQDETAVASATKTIKIVYYASIMAGECDKENSLEEINLPEKSDKKTENIEDDNLLEDILINPNPKNKSIKTDPLAEMLGINILACRAPLIPISKFYNVLLSDALEMDDDYQTWRENGNEKFSFMSHSFILTPSTKTLGLYYDNRIRMYENRRFCLIQTLIGQPTHPYLKLKVRREHVVQDALVELEMVALQNPSDLKKQLAVEFDGEQGVDEGGVSKEFFHLIVEELFNPDYGMFVIMNSDSGNPTYWFNSFSFETAAQYSLIGLIVGLAIYNNVILNINFPMVVYRKLLGKQCTFNDLQDWNLELYNGLKNLLDYEEDDIEEMFMQTFRICYKDAFGEIVYRDLIENGDQITVNHMNKREFVDKYADFLLNESIGSQFNAFYRGFQNVMEESPLQYLFWPEELEQIVCGSKIFDMCDLEETTLYEGGYRKTTEVIQYFWSFAHSLPRVSQQKLLQFTTGSDRVPVGGLGKLKLTITRNGSDSDRLPTAHTCFNVLLLPEYSSQEKLEERLSKAINYAEGFGMI